MAVSIDYYRFKIGCFQPNFTKQPKVQVRKCVNNATVSWLYILIYTYLLSFSSTAPARDNQTVCGQNFYKTTLLSESQVCEVSTATWHWGLKGFEQQKLNNTCHMVNGNRKVPGYKIAGWNCGRGLMSRNGKKTDKIADIKLFIEQNKPSLLGVIESDIHGLNSPSNRRTTFSKDDILDQLSIEGYSILLPDTWESYNQARIIVFASDDIKVKQRVNTDNFRDLPSMTLEIGNGRERKTLVNYYYREWTGGISSDNSQAGQHDRFSRQVQHWRDLRLEDKDLVLVGDANFCSQSCSDPNYPPDLKSIANIATDFYLEESMTQMIEQPTRTELRGNLVQKSCIDHITTNSPGKCVNSAVLVGGNSDHLAVITTKMAKEANCRPPLIKKRSYKYFKREEFLCEVRNTDFSQILDLSDINEASHMFTKIFGQILDNHAPVKIFQTRTNYAPWLSDATKEEMKVRNDFKMQSVTSNDPEILRQYKTIRNRIKAKLPDEEEHYYKEKLKHKDVTIKEVWKTAYEILGQNKDLSPKQLNYI